MLARFGERKTLASCWYDYKLVYSMKVPQKMEIELHVIQKFSFLGIYLKKTKPII